MKNPHAQALGKLGGLARSAKLTMEQKAASMAHAREMKAKRRAIRAKL